ncbi:MAG: adenylosuccinate lyase [Gammaproteobacteria bacterium]|jgi:adenylosuccinate lyase|nr:adenylosuccinate lyase [Gammaproteobacteria bacterium]MAO98660.1 adenylosuccinate lyase [Gammaproteobacteria bacterium]|tara:strand:+ start:3882 stop:5234 length:1353 start_codon:yes stop_codon:yes gene_type:complete
MDESQLRNLSPLDGRYRDKTNVTREIFSEHALIIARIKSEASWLEFFLENFRKDLLTKDVKEKLNQLSKSPSSSIAIRTKEIEQTTNHDVKAVELALAEEFDGNEELQSLIHIFLTSEDVNSLSYAMMLQSALGSFQKLLISLTKNIQNKSDKFSDLAMLARTHGQPATPTTLGKELNVFNQRLRNELKKLKKQKVYAKWGGATANYNPHLLAFPEMDWLDLSKSFLAKQEIALTSVSTQIEPHDYMADIFQNFVRINNILIDFSHDIWTYISQDYFKLKLVENEVGSSTMPHKVNPIDFENAEGNLGLSTAIFNHLADKLTKSRLQRDLSDSTVLRNIGSAFGYLEIAITSLEKGIQKLDANVDKIASDLSERYELLAEPLQSFLRLEGKKDAYDLVKKITRGKTLTRKSYIEVVEKLIDNKKYKKILLQLKPESYLGLAKNLAKKGDI